MRNVKMKQKLSRREIDELCKDLTRRSKRLLEHETIDKLDVDFVQAKAEYNSGNIAGGFTLKEDVVSRLHDYIAEIEDVLCGLNILSEQGDVPAFAGQATAECITLKAECAELLTRFEDEWQTNSWAYWRQLHRE
jgi:hypothetical protein